jgi:hypothetical protein
MSSLEQIEPVQADTVETIVEIDRKTREVAQLFANKIAQTH